MTLRALLLAVLLPVAAALAGTPIPIKVVVVATFEIGADKGDAPGEFQHWAEGEHLDQVIPFPAGFQDLKMNSSGVLGLVCGCGKTQAAASVMALGLDPRFDLSHAYWILSGIGGVNPRNATIGSVTWARWVVDGDLAHEIDAREIPKDWATGYFPFGATHPYSPAPNQLDEDQNARFFYRRQQLNAGIAQWAYRLTAHVPLQDDPTMTALRRRFTETPAAQTPPRVYQGDVISTDVFWHGKKMSERAEAWTAYSTGDKATYVMCAMEDIGCVRSLTLLDRARKVDFSRVLVSRGGSNFDEPPPGMDPVTSLTKEFHNYSGYLPSLENLYRTGHVVLAELTSHWDKYKDSVPSAPAP